MVGVSLEDFISKRLIEVSLGELTKVAIPPPAQALVRQLEDLTGRIQARSLRKHHSLMGFQACDDLVHSWEEFIQWCFTTIFVSPIIAKFVVFACPRSRVYF
jgi:hypothetical protein